MYLRAVDGGFDDIYCWPGAKHWSDNLYAEQVKDVWKTDGDCSVAMNNEILFGKIRLVKPVRCQYLANCPDEPVGGFTTVAARSKHYVRCHKDDYVRQREPLESTKLEWIDETETCVKYTFVRQCGLCPKMIVGIAKKHYNGHENGTKPSFVAVARWRNITKLKLTSQLKT